MWIRANIQYQMYSTSAQTFPSLAQQILADQGADNLRAIRLAANLLTSALQDTLIKKNSKETCHLLLLNSCLPALCRSSDAQLGL